ncbi:polysaccharide biosynthesis tyrosine autokinase [Faecalicatena contorta]|uniref:polysaccharide biosynthesis tyrosine autokinase n=1 Tax=Faecalicatena contorta TaxID=39482 RepID=UPI0022855AA1|nr:polysaccharide biosynthesis tyrosine autokinase [Faecalicatena contorta]MCF2683224.1 polysaccharide biosynthesis tyrosine autokinase [Faecalicatena contorta]
MGVQENEKSQEPELIDITEMLSDYFRIFRRMWAWVLILTLLGTGIFYIRARVQYQPRYTASATFTVNIQRDQQGVGESGTVAFYNNSAAEQMAKTFPYILTSGVLKRKVAKDMGTGSVTGNIQANVAENTNLLTISVTDRDAGRAYAILQSVIKNYPEISEVIVGKTNMEMLDETGIPPEPDNPKDFKKSALKGGLFGFLIAALWTALLVVTRRTVRKESDIHRWMHTRCMGTVPEIHEKRRSGTSQTRMVLTDPKVEEKLQESFRMIRNKVEYHAHEYHLKTFLITSALAGEGKSTIAVNLALSLAQAGKKVVLIDCDLRHPTDRKILNLDPGEGLGEVLEHKKKLAECIIKSKDMGLDPEMRLMFLPGGTSLRDGSELLGTEFMHRIISRMEEWADYVILDSAPAGLLTDAVVLAQYADAAVFVVRKDFARVDHIMDGMEHLAESQVQIIGGILNGV